MPLMNTLPASSSRASRVGLRAIARPRRRAQAERAWRWRARSPRRCRRRGTAPPPGRRPPRARRARRAARRRAPSAGRSSPGRRGAGRPTSSRAPAATERVDLVGDARRGSTPAPAARARCRAASDRRPRSAAIAAAKSRANCVVDGVGDDEALGGDARLAVVDDARLDGRRRRRAVRSALGSTMNASLPPSSSTLFLMCLPAVGGDVAPGALAAGRRSRPRRDRRR